jgi:hypothetical protein
MMILLHITPTINLLKPNFTVQLKFPINKLQYFHLVVELAQEISSYIGHKLRQKMKYYRYYMYKS